MPTVNPNKPVRRTSPTPTTSKPAEAKKTRGAGPDSFENAKRIADPSVNTPDVGRLEYKPVDGKLFVKGASLGDIQQGEVGTCFLLASLGSLVTENPARAKELIRENKDGTFTATFYENGKKVEVTVDSDLAHTQDGEQRYAKVGDKGELWVPMLEKAYVSWKGGYQKFVVGGDPTHALAELTNKPWKEVAIGTTTSPDDVMTLINDALKGKSGGCVAGTSQYASPPLRPGHAYTILEAVEQDGEKWVRIRDPFQKGPAMAGGREDGSFRLRLDDFQRNFFAVMVPA